ncbi:MAG: hypothetical protein KDK89_14570 [Alphaproteobacteria bacterium]|nr:hypothetical protein [Alphaproteobacteria bacterium]
MKTPHQLFVLICLAGTALVSPAQATEVPPAIQAMFDNLERQTSIKPAYETIETDGSGTVTISKMTMNKDSASGDPAIKMMIDKVVLSGIADQGNGLYEIGNATFSGMKVDMGAPDFSATITAPEGHAEGWYVKVAGENATPEETLRASMNVARRMTSGKITVDMMGQSVTADSYETIWDGDPATGAGKFNMKITNIAIPEQAIAMADQSGMLKQLGYNGLNFDVTSDGRFDLENGNIGLVMDFAVAGHEIGTMIFTLGASGIPLAVYQELQTAQKSGKEPDFGSLMPQIQNITLEKFRFRFEDSSVTNRVLPLVASMQGMDQAALVANAGAMLQLGLMQLQNQEFTDNTVTAVSNYLKDPQSITVALKPAAPIKVSDLMALDPNAPGEAIKKLGVTVSSNE